MKAWCAVLVLAVGAGCGDEGEATVPAAALDVSLADVAGLDVAASIDAGADTADGPEGCGGGADPATGLVAVSGGAVQGHLSGDVWEFQGIPYAAPPVGDLRLRSPQPAACISGTLDAAEYAPKCPQVDATTKAVVGEEDCLYLNVWTPKDAPGPLPVLVFIHGGGNVFGAPSEKLLGLIPVYHGADLAAAGPAVVVTLAYRLGGLGFAALDELGADGGNLALQDQLAALRWVQENAAAFGGDKDRVLVFGESAGGLDTCALVTSPRAKGLFRAALVQSGACLAASKEAATATTDAWLTTAGCAGAADRLACLRALPAADLVLALTGEPSIGAAALVTEALTWGPWIDGDVLPQAPGLALQSGAWSGETLVLGTNADETAALLEAKAETAEEVDAVLEAMFAPLGPDVVAEAKALYSAAAFPTPQDALVAVTTDMRFTCPMRIAARAAAGKAGAAVYRYLFSVRPVSPLVKGAIHGLELLYVFQHVQEVPTYTATAIDLAAEAVFGAHWTSFAATGGPASGPPAWPKYEAASDPYLEIGPTIEARAGLRTAACDAWDGWYMKLLGSNP